MILIFLMLPGKSSVGNGLELGYFLYLCINIIMILVLSTLKQY